MKVLYLSCWQVSSPCRALFLLSEVQLVHLLLSQLGYLSWTSPGFPRSVIFFLFLAYLMLDDILVSHTGSLSSRNGN